MTILIAEDDMTMQSTLALCLKMDGHNVIACADGKEALTKIEEMSPDLIITDIMLPFSSGLEIIDTVKNKAGKKIPIIILSAVDEENVMREAFKLGADDYIPKPFSPNELSMKVKGYRPV